MRCKVCDKCFHPSRIPSENTRTLAEDLQVCATCQTKIKTLDATWGKRRERAVTKCVICGKDTYHYNNHETCGYGGCKSKWYRIKAEKKNILNAIKTNDYDKIEHLKISQIIKRGFKIKILEVPNDE